MSTVPRRLRLLVAACLVILSATFVASSAEAKVHHHARGRHHRAIAAGLRHSRLSACPGTPWAHALRLERRRERRLARLRHARSLRRRCTTTGVTSGGAVSTTTNRPSTGASPCGCTTTGTSPTGSAGSTSPSPAPAPSTTSSVQSDTAMGGGGSGWDGYGGGSLPGAGWRPYSDSSPFNQTVAGASIVPNSQAYVNDALQWGTPATMATTANTTMDYSHPTYYAQPTDPVYTLHQTGGWSGSIEGQQIHIPSYAHPADGGDGHMTVVEPDGWEYDFWQVHSMANGVLSYTAGGRTMINGNGLDSGATAAMFGNLAGVIRAPELAAGHIDHALFIVLKCASASNDTSFGYGTEASSGSNNSSYVYPAAAGGAQCPSGESSVPLGTRFMLDLSPSQIQALSVPTYEKTILTALATYGGYVGDTGGPGFSFMFESSMTYTQLGLPDPLVTYGAQNGLSTWSGEYLYNVSGGVNWQQYLKVVAPPSQA